MERQNKMDRILYVFYIKEFASIEAKCVWLAAVEMYSCSSYRGRLNNLPIDNLCNTWSACNENTISLNWIKSGNSQQCNVLTPA